MLRTWDFRGVTECLIDVALPMSPIFQSEIGVKAISWVALLYVPVSMA